MLTTIVFERLVASVTLIARHADYPGKRETIEQCRCDVEDLADSGRISTSQQEILLDILLVEHLRVA